MATISSSPAYGDASDPTRFQFGMIRDKNTKNILRPEAPARSRTEGQTTRLKTNEYVDTRKLVFFPSQQTTLPAPFNHHVEPLPIHRETPHTENESGMTHVLEEHPAPIENEDGLPPVLEEHLVPTENEGALPPVLEEHLVPTENEGALPPVLEEHPTPLHNTEQRERVQTNRANIAKTAHNADRFALALFASLFAAGIALSIGAPPVGVALMGMAIIGGAAYICAKKDIEIQAKGDRELPQPALQPSSFHPSISLSTPSREEEGEEEELGIHESDPLHNRPIDNNIIEREIEGEDENR